jgi:hypothetical protein
MTRVTFDNATRPDLIGAAIAAIDHPGDPLDREMRLWAKVEDERFWGRAEDAGGAPVVVEQTPDGTILVLGGRPVPAILSGGVWSVGLPGRVGLCAAWAVEAVERQLRAGASPSLCFGRAFGSAQTWATAAGQVWDLTLSEEPWPEAEYRDALHARAQTVLEIPDLPTLRAFHEAINDGAWDAGWRPDSLSNEALARRRQRAEA